MGAAPVQPKVMLCTQQHSGFCCLMRCNGPDGLSRSMYSGGCRLGGRKLPSKPKHSSLRHHGSILLQPKPGARHSASVQFSHIPGRLSEDGPADDGGEAAVDEPPGDEEHVEVSGAHATKAAGPDRAVTPQKAAHVAVTSQASSDVAAAAPVDRQASKTGQPPVVSAKLQTLGRQAFRQGSKQKGAEAPQPAAPQAAVLQPAVGTREAQGHAAIEAGLAGLQTLRQDMQTLAEQQKATQTSMQLVTEALQTLQHRHSGPDTAAQQEVLHTNMQLANRILEQLTAQGAAQQQQLQAQVQEAVQGSLPLLLDQVAARVSQEAHRAVAVALETHLAAARPPCAGIPGGHSHGTPGEPGSGSSQPHTPATEDDIRQLLAFKLARPTHTHTSASIDLQRLQQVEERLQLVSRPNSPDRKAGSPWNLAGLLKNPWASNVASLQHHQLSSQTRIPALHGFHD